jgi:hypothetical protein
LATGQQRDRSKLLGSTGCDPEKERSRRRLRQGRAGAVVGLDGPAPEQCRDALRELAVRSDQRRRPPRHLERLAKRKRDRLRLGGGVGQLGKADPAQPALMRRELLPLLR